MNLSPFLQANHSQLLTAPFGIPGFLFPSCRSRFSWVFMVGRVYSSSSWGRLWRNHICLASKVINIRPISDNSTQPISASASYSLEALVRSQRRLGQQGIFFLRKFSCLLCVHSRCRFNCNNFRKNSRIHRSNYSLWAQECGCSYGTVGRFDKAAWWSHRVWVKLCLDSCRNLFRTTHVEIRSTL